IYSVIFLEKKKITQIISNDVTSDILLTTIHVITDWPISDHMIGTSHRGPVQRSVFCCVLRTHETLIVRQDLCTRSRSRDH
ncbi:unnamed protein product, partial [Staurois parvus]